MKIHPVPLAAWLLAATLIQNSSAQPFANLPPADGNGFMEFQTAESNYYGYRPDTYNAATPISLFVWMHGCGGEAFGDMFAIAPFATRANQSYIAISLGGRDGVCWQMNTDAPKVFAAIADIRRYFNIDPRRIYLGGYSSGGDLTYNIGLQNPGLFAGLLVENSSPFRDSAINPATLPQINQLINVAHLAHLSDIVYPIASVRAELAQLSAKGYTVTAIERPGGHSDPDNGNFGTNYDLRTFLLPYLDAGWLAPLPPGSDAPTISASALKKFTNRPRVVARGTSTAATRVEYKFGKRGYRLARGTPAQWRVTLRLKPGKNSVRLRATGPGGTSPVLRLSTTRR